MTTSAPRSSGLVSKGVATVESTANKASQLRAISATAAMSVTVHKGLPGVSSQMSVGAFSVMAWRNSSRFDVSTKRTSSPLSTPKVCSHLRNAQYMTLGAMTESPGFNA